jgi:hypothetical protein
MPQPKRLLTGMLIDQLAGGAMAFEVRHGKRYFYHSKRVDGKVKKTYYGCGLLAEMYAEAFEAIKEKRQFNRERLNAAKAGLKLIPRQMEQLRRAPLDAVEAYPPPRAATDPPLPPPLPTPETVLIRAKVLLEARRAGDETAESQLTDLVDRYPTLTYRLGDVAGLARASWVSMIAGKDIVFRKSIMNRLEHMRSEYPANDSPVSVLLVERILATWLQLNYFEAKLASVDIKDLKNLEYLKDLQQKAERQHLEAIERWHHWQTCQEVKI